MNKNPDTSRSTVLFEKHEMLLDVIKMFNTNNNENDIINIMLGIIQYHTGIESIALRVKINNDYPFIAARGFTEDFIRSETLLACSDKEGTALPPYECICGMILENVNSTVNPCFTAGGSFRINSPDDPNLKSLTESPNRRFRMRCLAEGYNSIAIVPIRAQEEIMGLMQFNDRRKGIFTDDFILFFESCCHALGLALHRRSVDFGMYKANRDLENIIEERTIELLKTIRDKDRLLDEVNHRIKNNLLIISSLINLQAMKESNLQIREALNGALARINSMGIIHHKLYSSRDLDHIDIEDYLVALYNRIIQAYDIDPSSVEFIQKCKDITVNIDTAIPCGLILNEIISNSVRHGMKTGKKLTVSVIISQTENMYSMVISDNGPGLKTGFNMENNGNLGMELIKALVKQLDGTIDMYNNDGLVCEIRINKELKEENRWKQKMS